MKKIHTILAYASLVYCGGMTVMAADMFAREANEFLDDWLTK